MRLRWGPHAMRSAEQVMISDPLYVLDELDSRPDGRLAGVFQDLIHRFDTRPFTAPCARCHRPGAGVCAYPGSTDLIGFCVGCVAVSEYAAPRPAVQVLSYEDALRHMATSFRRGHRIQMRRIAKHLLRAKGGPIRLTEADLSDYFEAALIVGVAVKTTC